MNAVKAKQPDLYKILDPGLRDLFERALERLVALDGMLAGWHYGSLARGLCDQYSDVDPVFLVDDSAFNRIDEQLMPLFSAVCDQVVLVWPEDYNNHSFKNFGLLLKHQEALHQFDIFFVCKSRMDDHFCRWHYEGLGRNNLIFDRTGIMADLLDRPLPGSPPPEKAPREPGSFRESLLPRFVSYLFHLNMGIKYYLRGDILKLQNIRQRLYAEHAHMLLATVPPQVWGSLEAQVHHSLPGAAAQELTTYFFCNDIHELMANLTCLAGKAATLTREACRQRNEEFPWAAWAEVNHSLCRRLKTGPDFPPELLTASLSHP